MSGHAAFRRQPVPGEMAISYQSTVLPAPIRGIIEVENWAYTKPGCAVVLDNWFCTQKGLRLRGGTERWATLPAPTEIVRSGFDYVSGAANRMFAATATRIFDISFADNPVLETGVGTITNGNFSTAQFATAGGDFLLAVNDVGDYVRRFNGTIWELLDTAYAGTPSRIVGPAGSSANILDGKGLTHIWKYRDRLFFIEGGSMNAWCLPTHAVGGTLINIPLSGAAKRGGSLLFGAVWSTDAGNSTDDKCCFFTDQGEVLVFSGTDPTNVNNWRQDRSLRYFQAARQERASDTRRRSVDRHGRRHRADVIRIAERRVGAVAGGDHLQHRANVDAGVAARMRIPGR